MRKKLSSRFWLSCCLILLLCPAVIWLCARSGGRSFYVSALLMICCTIAAFFFAFEARKPQAREVVILAVLCALAVASRAALIAVPNFKPMTAIVMIAGIALGPEAGFLTGAISGFASNFIFGQGPWTPWQMFAYGFAGFLFGLLARLKLLPRKPVPLAICGFAAVVILIGPMLDTCALFIMSGVINAETAATVYLAGIPVNLIHASATGLTLLLFSKPLLDRLARIQLKYGLMEDNGDAL